MVYILLLTCPVPANGAYFFKEQNISTEFSSLIFAYLQASDLGKFGLTSKHNRNLLREYISSPVHSPNGQNLRKSSYFNIKMENGNFLFIQEYLEKDKPKPISRITNHVELAKKHPNTFFQIALKASPKHDKLSYTQLKHYHQQILDMGSIVDQLQAPKSPGESLANVLIELMSWMHIWWSQAKDTVLNKVWEEIDEEIGSDTAYQLKDELSLLIESRVRSETRDALWDQLWDQIGDELGKYIWDTASQIERLAEEQVKPDLSHFPFGLAYKHGNLKEVVELAIDYTFMIYQIQNIVLRNTMNFHKLHKNLSHRISSNLTNIEIIGALRGLNIPPKISYFLVETHLHIIRNQVSTILKNREYRIKPNHQDLSITRQIEI